MQINADIFKAYDIRGLYPGEINEEIARLIESFLAEALGMPWDRVHDEAEVLEHYISEDLEALIAAKLGEPSHDPHGDPIPGPDLGSKLLNHFGPLLTDQGTAVNWLAQKL